MRFAAGTDKGLIREINEDSYTIIKGCDGSPYVFAVADGMGGHNCGEIASGTAIEYISNSIADGSGRFLPLENCKPELVKLVEKTNTAVYQKSLDIPAAAGMGTTLTMVLIDNDSIAIAYVGDSRLYLARSEKLEKLTNDHSYNQE